MELHRTQVQVRVRPPFSLATTCEVVAAASPFRPDLRFGPGSLTRALAVGAVPVVVRVTDAGQTGRPALVYDLFAAVPWTPPMEDAATRGVSGFLGLEDDLAGFYHLAENDEALAPVVHRFFGYRPVRFPSAFEAATWAVLSQHNHWNVARKMKEALVAGLGSGLALEGADYWVFPPPAAVAKAGPDRLRWLLRNERRAISLLAVAAAFAHVDAAFLSDAPTAQVLAWLRGIHGIGPWSAAFILQRGVGRSDAPLLIDKSLVRAVLAVYGPHRMLRTDDVARLAERYGEHRGLWAHYVRVAVWIGRRAPMAAAAQGVRVAPGEAAGAGDGGGRVPST